MVCSTAGRCSARHAPGASRGSGFQGGHRRESRHRELALSLPHARGVEVPSLRSPLRFSATPVTHRASPMLGEHSAQVLADELEIGPERLRGLRERGVI